MAVWDRLCPKSLINLCSVTSKKTSHLCSEILAVKILMKCRNSFHVFTYNLNAASEWPPRVLNSLLSVLFPAPFQCQRSWQGQDGRPAEVKELPDSDTSDWPMCLLCVCNHDSVVLGLQVNYQDMKTINKSLHPLCCPSPNYVDFCCCVILSLIR